jgi:hypothetical protein
VDAYHRHGAGEWGSKSRKALSRQKKSSFRRSREDESMYCVKIGDVLYPLAAAPVEGRPLVFSGRTPHCLGLSWGPRDSDLEACGADLGESGFTVASWALHPWPYQVQCLACGTRVDVVEGDLTTSRF